jgi:hypothetical protein
MIQLRPGDLVEVVDRTKRFHFAILTKQMLFGGHWCFAFYEAPPALAASGGFNAFVDFIVPKREGRVSRLSAANDLSNLQGPELLQQEPTKGEVTYAIYRWKDRLRQDVEAVRSTTSPRPEERAAPRYACIPANWACELIERKWNPGMSLWVA